MMGLYYTQTFNITAQFDYRLSRHTEQYLSEQTLYSSLTIPRVPLNPLQQDCLRQASAHNLRLHSPAVYLAAR